MSSGFGSGGFGQGGGFGNGSSRSFGYNPASGNNKPSGFDSGGGSSGLGKSGGMEFGQSSEGGGNESRYCHQERYFSRECPNKNNRCSNCNGEGHQSRDCLKPRKPREQREEEGGSRFGGQTLPGGFGGGGSTSFFGNSGSSGGWDSGNTRFGGSLPNGFRSEGRAFEKWNEPRQQSDSGYHFCRQEGHFAREYLNKNNSCFNCNEKEHQIREEQPAFQAIEAQKELEIKRALSNERQSWEDQLEAKLKHASAAHSDHLEQVVRTQRRLFEIEMTRKIEEAILIEREAHSRQMDAVISRLEDIESALSSRIALDNENREVESHAQLLRTVDEKKNGDKVNEALQKVDTSSRSDNLAESDGRNFIDDHTKDKNLNEDELRQQLAEQQITLELLMAANFLDG